MPADNKLFTRRPVAAVIVEAKLDLAYPTAEPRRELQTIRAAL
jgi:hypothetical protein